MPEGMEGMGDFNDIFSSWNDADAVGNTSLGLPTSGGSGVSSGQSNVIGGNMGSGSLGGSMGMGRSSMGTRGDCSSQPGSPPSSQPCSPFTCGSSSYRVCEQLYLFNSSFIINNVFINIFRMVTAWMAMKR